MTKEEILKKNQQHADRDEREQQIENQARGAGFIAMTALFVFFIVANLFRGKDNYAIFSIFWGCLSVEAFYKYRGLKKGSSSLITAICGAIASILFLVCYFVRG